MFRGKEQLPVPISSFIGRADDLQNVHRLLRTARLVTLTGPGGVGKTRLALQAAAGLQTDFVEGAYLVDLAPLSDDSLLTAEVLHSIGLQEEPGRPTESLIQHLQSKSVLLIMDNCEHLVEGCGRLIEVLLANCRDLRVLATSRECLAVDGEQLWRVAPLGVTGPDAHSSLEDLALVPAVQLFVDRAQAVDPTFALMTSNARDIAEICWRVDGLPLAIELAARRIQVLSPQEIAGRLGRSFGLLRDTRRAKPARHQTLHELLEWSHRLLQPQECRVFERVSVFAGDWSLEAAEAICSGDEVAPEDVLDVLSRLIDKSLILSVPGADGMHYRLLETLRQFGRAQLHASQEDDNVCRRHAEFYAALAQCAAQKWRTPQQKTWLRRLDSVYDNLRIALEWHVRNAAPEGLHLAAHLRWFWERTGRVSEARQWLHSLLAVSAEHEPMRAAALVTSGHLALIEGDMTAARQLLEHGLRQAREQSDARVVAAALTQLARVTNRGGAVQAARVLSRQSLCVSRATADPQEEIDALLNFGIVAAEQGDHAAARAGYEQSISRARDIGDDWSLALALRSLGHIARTAGDSDTARSLFEEALGIWTNLDDAWGLAWSLSGLGYLAIEAEDLPAAEKLFRQCLELRRGLGARGSVANSLEGFASLAAARGQPHRAYRLAGAVLHLRGSMDDRPPAAEQAAFERTLESARRNLSAHERNVALAAGGAMTLDEAIAFAFEIESSPFTDSGAADLTHSRVELTPRELEVATLIARGQNNRELAESLVIAGSTAERHVANILNKLQLRSRTEVAMWAVEQNLTR